MIEFLDDHPPRTRSTPALRLTLVSGFLGFLLGIAPLIAIVPSIDQPQDAYPLAAPERPAVERGARPAGRCGQIAGPGGRLAQPDV